VEISLSAETVSVNRLVRQSQHVEQRVEMAHRRMHVDRLDRIAAPEVDGVKRVSESKKIAVVGDRPSPSSAGAIESVGGAGDRAERDMRAADLEMARRVARVQDEGPRRKADMRFDERRVEAHPAQRAPDVG